MTFKTAVLAGLLATGLVLPMAGAAIAQSVGTVDLAMAEQAQDRAPDDNWLKVCDTLDDGRQACIMRQVVTNGGVFTGSFLLRDDPSQESRLLAVAAVPLGVLLPFGLTWQIDGSKPVRVPFMTCDPQSCAAQLVVNEAYVQSLKQGSALRLTAKNRRNEDINIDITLIGFTSTYESDDAMTIDQLNQAGSTENVLEQVLQDRAEQMRQQLGSDGEEVAPAAAAEPAAEGEMNLDLELPAQ